MQALSLDGAETTLDLRPVDGETPDRAYDRRWAYNLLERARQHLRAEYEGCGQCQSSRCWSRAWCGMGYAEFGAQLTFLAARPATYTSVWLKPKSTAPDSSTSQEASSG